MWRKPTEDDLVATLSSEEIEAYKNDFGASSDPIGILTRRASAMVRSYLRTNGMVRMSPDEDLIPEATISPAMDYLAIDVLKRISIEPTQVRKDARRDAIAYFDKIASRQLVCEPYSDGSEDPGGNVAGSPASASANPVRLLD